MIGEIVFDAMKMLVSAVVGTFAHFFPARLAITAQESMQILNVSTKDPRVVMRAFEILYTKNSPENGSSAYIRSRILNAFKGLSAL